MASRIDLEISDLPPPETVAGLCSWVCQGAVPIMCHCLGLPMAALQWMR